jgi:hypothetical protein
MKDFSKIKKELLEIREKLEKIDPEKGSKIEIDFLRARALDLVEQILSGKHTSEKISNLGGELDKKDLIELINLARDAAQDQSLSQIFLGTEEKSISDIVFTAFWQGRAVKIFLTIFFVLFSISFSLATFGTITIFNKASKASEILVEADRNLQEAKDTLDRGDLIKKQISQSIEDFDGQFRKLENSIGNLKKDLDAAKRNQNEHIEKYTKEIREQITEFRTLTNKRTTSFNKEYSSALSQIKDKPGELDKEIDKQTENLSKKSDTFKNDFYNPLINRYRSYQKRFSKINTDIESLEDVTENNISTLLTIAKNLVVSRKKVNDEIIKRENSLIDLVKKAEALNTIATTAETQYGSIDARLQALNDLNKGLIEAKDKINFLVRDADIIRTLVGDLNEKSSDVYGRVKEAMKLSVEEISNSFIRVFYSDRWYKILGIALMVQFAVFIIWFFVHGKRIKRDRLQMNNVTEHLEYITKKLEEIRKEG